MDLGNTRGKGRRRRWAAAPTDPRRERRNFVVWIHLAQQSETRERRLRESIALRAAGRKLGLK